MSIIIDALKKAEEDRVSSNPQNPTSPPSFHSSQSPSKKSFSTLSLVLLFGILIGGGILAFNKFHKQPLFPTNIIPKSVSRVNTPPPTSAAQDSAKLKEEAMALFAKNDLAESQVKWNALSILAPADAETFNNLGVVSKKLGQTKQAQIAYEKALEINPNYPEALNNLGTLFLEAGSLTQAETMLAKSIALKPDYAEAHFHLAVLKDNSGKKEEATSHYKEFLKLSQNIDPRLKGQVEIRLIFLQATEENN